MFSVIFEVDPKAERFDDYLANAKHLKPILESIDGFIDNERFESQSRKGWLLSHSTWRDEKSVVRWRTTGAHHEIQEQGRSGIFSDYHLRVGEVVADSTPPNGMRILEQRLDETEVGAAKYVTLTELEPEQKAALAPPSGSTPAHLGLDISNNAVVAHDTFASINNPGKLAVLVSWKTFNEARAFSPKPFAGVARLRHRLVRVIRDYGMFDRREAPQYYPDVEQSPRPGDKGAYRANR